MIWNGLITRHLCIIDLENNILFLYGITRQTLHGTAIYAYIDPQYHPNVGIYGSPMECPGSVPFPVTCSSCPKTSGELGGIVKSPPMGKCLALQ